MAWNLQVQSVEIPAGVALGVRIGNPQNPEKATILVLIGKRGLIVCRNFDTVALEQRGIAAARVQGISTFEEALTAPIESCTVQARQMGVTEGMKGADALARFL